MPADDKTVNKAVSELAARLRASDGSPEAVAASVSEVLAEYGLRPELLLRRFAEQTKSTDPAGYSQSCQERQQGLQLAIKAPDQEDMVRQLDERIEDIEAGRRTLPDRWKLIGVNSLMFLSYMAGSKHNWPRVLNNPRSAPPPLSEEMRQSILRFLRETDVGRN